MHELSLAEGMVRIAERHAGERRVVAVEVTVGHLRQVVPSALRFAFTLVSEGTVLEGATLTIVQVPARGRCRACGAETTMSAFPLQCGQCAGLDMEVVAGDELRVEALELEEPMTTEGVGHGR